MSDAFDRRRQYFLGRPPYHEDPAAAAQIGAGLATGYLATQILDDAVLVAAVTICTGGLAHRATCCSASRVLFDERVMHVELLQDLKELLEVSESALDSNGQALLDQLSASILSDF